MLEQWLEFGSQERHNTTSVIANTFVSLLKMKLIIYEKQPKSTHTPKVAECCNASNHLNQIQILATIKLLTMNFSNTLQVLGNKMTDVRLMRLKTWLCCCYFPLILSACAINSETKCMYDVLFDKEEQLNHLLVEKEYVSAANFYLDHIEFFKNSRHFPTEKLQHLAQEVNIILESDLLAANNKLSIITEWPVKRDKWPIYKQALKTAESALQSYERYLSLIQNTNISATAYTELKENVLDLRYTMLLNVSEYITTLDQQEKIALYNDYPIALPRELVFDNKIYTKHIFEEQTRFNRILSKNQSRKNIQQKFKASPINFTNPQITQPKVTKVEQQKPPQNQNKQWLAWPFGKVVRGYSAYLGSYKTKRTIDQIIAILGIKATDIVTKSVYVGRNKYLRIFLTPSSDRSKIDKIISKALASNEMPAILLQN